MNAKNSWKIKDEYKDNVKSIILSEGFWNGSKYKRKKLLRKELPNIPRWQIDWIVDFLVSFSYMHNFEKGIHEARMHEIVKSKFREVMRQLNISWEDIRRSRLA